MDIQSLSNVSPEDIVNCFDQAFADYPVRMPREVDYWRLRWRGARVDMAMSTGVFDHGELVGFMLHGVDSLDGLRTAHNSGTGVLPVYRGRGLVQQMYDHLRPALLAHGIRRCSLEVLTDNHRAIKAYQNTGLRISTTLHCFSGDLKAQQDVALNELSISAERLRALDQGTRYAWESNNAAVSAVSDRLKLYEVHSRDQRIGHFILSPERAMLVQFEIDTSAGEEAWPLLFSGVAKKCPTVRINNIYSDQKERLHAVREAGLKPTVDQHEMTMDLSPQD